MAGWSHRSSLNYNSSNFVSLCLLKDLISLSEPRSVQKANSYQLDPKTARKYVRSEVVVLAARGPRTWRTRTDPLGAAWALAEGYLKSAPELEARALFEPLLETAGEAMNRGASRKQIPISKTADWRWNTLGESS